MTFQGTFDVLDFAEVLRLLARQEMTGRLHVRSRSISANLHLEQGHVVGADQSEHASAATVGDVQGRVEEVCFELLDTDRGAFEFLPAPPGTQPVTTRLDVATVLERAWQRLAEWRSMQEVIPSLDYQPRLVTDLAQDSVTLDRERWRVLTTIDGRRSLRAIGRFLGLSDFDVYRLTIALADAGAIEPIDPRPPLSTAIEDLGAMSAIDLTDDEESVTTIVSADAQPTGGEALVLDAPEDHPDPAAKKPRRLVRIRSRSVET